MNSNSKNPHVGAEFQRIVKEKLEEKYNKTFDMEKKIAIGTPSKEHKFDIVAADNTMAIECKCYSWTVSGNVPSAKMGFVNEAAFYLSFLPDTYDKYIIMSKAIHEKRTETLAEYYYRMNKHLLGNIKVAEYDSKTKDFRVLC